MTLRWRTPRAVYRVYGEDEFFADATVAPSLDVPAQDMPEQPASPPRLPRRGAGERQRGAFVAASMLVAATGVVGGLVATVALSPTENGGRRVHGQPRAVRGSLASTTATRHRVVGATAGHDASRSGVGGNRSALRRRRHAQLAGQRAGLAVVRSAVRLSAAVGASRDAPVHVAVPIRAARLTARASAGPAGSGRSEFGFER
jgi:hypothetical protein